MKTGITALERAYVDWMACRVHYTPRGFRLSARGRRSRAPSWAAEVRSSWVDLDTFDQAASFYVADVLGWQWRDSRWMAGLYCPCGLSVRGGHPQDDHEPTCVLAEL